MNEAKECTQCGSRFARGENEGPGRFAVRKFCSFACYHAYGRPTATAPRFWSKVRKGDDCWEWTATTRNGYGQFSIGGAMQKAHRASWVLAFGEIPAGMCVLHRCDNPLCVRPEHLFLGTQLDNIRDREAKGRGRGAKTHCSQGHEYTPENTYIRRDGCRTCRACSREYHLNRRTEPASCQT